MCTISLGGHGTSKIVRARYTLEYKQEAVRLVEGGRAIGAVARDLGIAGQTVHNWVKAQAAGRFGDATVKSVNAEQVEIARLKAQLAQVKMERDILKKRRRISLRSRCEVRLHRATQNCLADRHAMPRAEGQRQRLQSVPGAPEKGRR